MSLGVTLLGMHDGCTGCHLIRHACWLHRPVPSFCALDACALCRPSQSARDNMTTRQQLSKYSRGRQVLLCKALQSQNVKSIHIFVNTSLLAFLHGLLLQQQSAGCSCSGSLLRKHVSAAKAMSYAMFYYDRTTSLSSTNTP